MPKKDILSKSDPFVKVFIKTQLNEQYRFLGQTEVINNNHDPDFVTTIPVDYYFERSQFLRFEVEDYDGPNKSDHLGVAETDIASIIISDRRTLCLDLLNN